MNYIKYLFSCSGAKCLATFESEALIAVVLVDGKPAESSPQCNNALCESWLLAREIFRRPGCGHALVGPVQR